MKANKYIKKKDKPVKVEGWEKDFRTRIINKEFGDYWHIDYPKLKSFIRSLLREEREKIIIEIEKEIEKEFEFYVNTALDKHLSISLNNWITFKNKLLKNL